MRLKSLEVVGFKSFLEPTVISFAPGVTAVVGPNGCGKSNIVDAIRWVLGEQAPTRLRGKLTEDLIYAGNDKHPPAGMAEVSLVMEADDERPLPEPFAGLSEVCVTRRVFRSGDSEYLLNKLPCRLKDITELFMASQIHSRGYAIIEQGKIEEVIHAKPGELRSLIEEAAGLSLFKGRRELSERKLERVKENLERLNDVLSEIERQLAYARRQAKKAETYRVLKHEADGLERLSAASRLLEQQSEYRLQQERESELKAALAQAREEYRRVEEEFEQLRAQEQSAREGLTSASRELENIQSAAAHRTQSLQFMRRRLEALDSSEPALRARIEETQSKTTAALAARAELGARLARETNAGGGGEAELAEFKREYQAASAELTRANNAAENLKDELSDLTREAAVIRGRLADLAGERATLAQRVAGAGRDPEEQEPDLFGEGQASDARLAEAGAAITQAEAELEAARTAVSEREAAAAAAADAELAARGAFEHRSARLKPAREALAAARARIERLRRSAAGERLRVVLESLNGHGPTRIPRFLQEVIQAPRELDPALHALLGEQLSTVIVESSDFALRAIEILKQKSRGRLSFMPESVTPGWHEAQAAAGIEGRLVDKLTIQDGFKPVVEALLGHVMLADSLPAALNAASSNGHGTAYVTREGDVIWPGSMITGGSAQELAGQDHEHVLSVEEAQAALEGLEHEFQVAELALTQARDARSALNEEMTAARRVAGAAERALSERRSALARIEQQIALANAHREAARRRLAEVETLIPAQNQRVAELAVAERELHEQLTARREQLLIDKTAAERLGERMRDLAARVESDKAHLQGLAQELRQVGLRVEELLAQARTDSKALAQAAAERAEFTAEITRLAGDESAAAERQSELMSELARRKLQCQELASELGARRATTDRGRAELERLQNEIIDCGLKAERAATLCQELGHSFAERFQAPFEELRTEMEAALSGREQAQDEARLLELRARLERIGEVNLAAESEVRELEERGAGLSAQREDLQKAVHDLAATVQKLNREARQRFAETFEGAARNFAEVFPKLMRGGKAHLELLNSEDLMEAGVNILVQPAGKKVKDISLLSGGEKALSAMALIFSLFLLNPSPFCLLDEVDAPLDEFSVAAFTGLVGELKARSQFLVITHNQRTMATADQMHGVTMEEPGISRIISLKLPEAAAA